MMPDELNSPTVTIDVKEEEIDPSKLVSEALNLAKEALDLAISAAKRDAETESKAQAPKTERETGRWTSFRHFFGLGEVEFARPPSVRYERHSNQENLIASAIMDELKRLEGEFTKRNGGTRPAL